MSEKYTAQGQVLAIWDTKQVSDKFRVREFAIEIPGERGAQYNQQVKFQATQDRCERLDDIKVGDTVDVSFNLRGREYTRKQTGEVDYFTSLDAWRVEMVVATQPSDMGTNSDVGGDDIPF